MTFDAGQLGSSPYGIVTASRRRPANVPSPDPSTTATSGTVAPGNRPLIDATASSTFWRYVISCQLPAAMQRSKQEPRDGGGDEVRQRTGQHGAQAETGQVV